MAKIGYLVLENGQIYKGISFGSETDVKGEVVFSTGMVGYPESYSDPSFFGQILVDTYPIIGNYGIPDNSKSDELFKHFESEKFQIRGLIVEQYIEEVSHWQASLSLSNSLVNQRIPALSGIDTRTITKLLREKGVMKGIITFKTPPDKNGGFSFIDINKDNLVPFVSVSKIIKYGSGRLKVMLIDCGLKFNQIRIMLDFNTTVFRVPWNYNPFKDKKAPKFDTIFISNGPGDARTMPETIETVREAFKRRIPVFGICLGHQIITLAAGGDIFKLRYGHRGQNQPVIDHQSGRAYITSQNHGYSSVTSSLPPSWRTWLTNLNDGTNEGIHHKNLPFFCVQFHPEANPGPWDTLWLFNYYFDSVRKWLKI